MNSSTCIPENPSHDGIYHSPLHAFCSSLQHPSRFCALNRKNGFLVCLFFKLSLSLALTPMNALNLNLLQAKGRSDLFLRLEVWKKILGVLILCATIPFGIFFMCCGLLLLSILELGINSYYTKRLIQYGIKKQIKDILPIIGLSIASFFCALLPFT